MFDKSLKAADLALAIANAAGWAVAGPAGALLSIVKPARALLKSDKPTHDLARLIQPACAEALGALSLSDDTRKLVIQLLQSHAPSWRDLARAANDPATVAATRRRRISETVNDPEATARPVLDAFERVVTAAVKAMLQGEARSAPRQLAFETQLLGMVSAMHEQMETSGEAQRLRDAGISEAAILELAQRISAKTDDPAQAWRDIQYAVGLAVHQQAGGQATGSPAAEVDDVLRRAAACSATGDYAAAGAAIEAELARQRASHAATLERLLQSGIEAALLAGDLEKAAALVIQRYDMAAGGQASLHSLREAQNHFYALGQAQGLTQPLELSVALSRAMLQRCTDADARGAVLCDLAMSLQTIGERAGTIEHLEQARTTYQAARAEFPRARDPYRWATVQNSYATLLRTLGEREDGVEGLSAAVEAYQLLLEEWSRDQAPQEWAMTQNNLGNALRALGEREESSARLEEAVSAFENALEELPRQNEPQDWAQTQMNRGSALMALGHHTRSAQTVTEAVAAFGHTLEVYTQERDPLAWAAVQMNLGNARTTLGALQEDTGKLAEAIAAYHAALDEWTQERTPQDWGLVQLNIATAHLNLFDLSGAQEELAVARAHAQAARGVFAESGADFYMAAADSLLSQITALDPA